MVWEVDKCKSDGRILLRRNTQISNGILYQYLGFAPTGKPSPTLIHPEEMGDIVVEKVSSLSLSLSLSLSFWDLLLRVTLLLPFYIIHPEEMGDIVVEKVSSLSLSSLLSTSSAC